MDRVTPDTARPPLTEEELEMLTPSEIYRYVCDRDAVLQGLADRVTPEMLDLIDAVVDLESHTVAKRDLGEIAALLRDLKAAADG